MGYAFVGGIAVMAWGQPRTTSDVGALADLSRDRVDDFVEALAREGLAVDRRDFVDAFEDRSHVTVFHDASGFHVDVKLVESAEERAEVVAGVRVDLVDGAVVVPPPEDTLAYKLLFGSQQDIKDAESILIRQAGRLDLVRLRGIARRLNVDSALEEMLARERDRDVD